MLKDMIFLGSERKFLKYTTLNIFRKHFTYKFFITEVIFHHFFFMISNGQIVLLTHLKPMLH